jgi:hypothetical protein
MIADLDETLYQLLKDELPIKNGEIEVSFEQPRRENSARWMKPTINLFLYDLRENNILRQPQWERLPGGNGSQAQQKRSPLRVDCYYMLTTWAADPQDEHRLLTRALMALSRFPTLPDDLLLGSLRNPPFNIQARLASHDKLTNPAEVWSALDNELRPSVSYILTLALDPWQVVTGPLVRTRTLRTGQAATIPRTQSLEPATQNELVWIGGQARRKNKPDEPLAGLEIAVKGTGYLASSDESGHFALGGLSPGDYILVAWLPEGKPKEFEIRVPAPEGHYDIEL